MFSDKYDEIFMVEKMSQGTLQIKLFKAQGIRERVSPL